MTRREIIALSLAFLITLPAVTSRLYASDEVQYYAWLRSLAFDHDADFQNEYQYFYDAGVSRSPAFHETFLERQTPSGRRMNFTTLGSALLWAPFYAAGHLAALATGAPADGYSRPYIVAVALGSAVYGFLAVVLSAAAARRVVGRGLAASLIVAVGTPLVFYSYVAPDVRPRHVGVRRLADGVGLVARAGSLDGGRCTGTWPCRRTRGDRARAGRVARVGTSARLPRVRVAAPSGASSSHSECRQPAAPSCYRRRGRLCARLSAAGARVCLNQRRRSAGCDRRSKAHVVVAACARRGLQPRARPAGLDAPCRARARRPGSPRDESSRTSSGAEGGRPAAPDVPRADLHVRNRGVVDGGRIVRSTTVRGPHADPDDWRGHPAGGCHPRLGPAGGSWRCWRCACGGTWA